MQILLLWTILSKVQSASHGECYLCNKWKPFNSLLICLFRPQAWAMMREISSLIYNASEEQVVRARNQLKASILFSQDGPGGELCSTCQLVHLLVFPPL